jgi:hypothetical protein
MGNFRALLSHCQLSLLCQIDPVPKNKQTRRIYEQPPFSILVERLFKFKTGF